MPSPAAREVTREEAPRLYNLLENLCISRGIPMPQLKIMESDALNAFATGLNQKQYSITVTRGLLERLTTPSSKRCSAHELTHIRNGDVRMMVIAVVIAGVISFFAEMFFRMIFRSAGFRGAASSAIAATRKGGRRFVVILIAIVLIALAWLLSMVIRFALSRSREFLADAGAVELTKNPDAMISALRKIEGRGELPGVTSAVMEMCVDNPREGFADLFASHPSIDRRVEALVQMAGGHDPGPVDPPPSRGSAAGRRRRDAGPARKPQAHAVARGRSRNGRAPEQPLPTARRRALGPARADDQALTLSPVRDRRRCADRAAASGVRSVPPCCDRRKRGLEFVIHAVILAARSSARAQRLDRACGPQHKSRNERQDPRVLPSSEFTTRNGPTWRALRLPTGNPPRDFRHRKFADDQRADAGDLASEPPTIGDERHLTFRRTARAEATRTSPKPSTRPSWRACSPDQYSPENKANSGPLSLRPAPRLHQRDEALVDVLLDRLQPRTSSGFSGRNGSSITLRSPEV